MIISNLFFEDPVWLPADDPYAMTNNSDCDKLNRNGSSGSGCLFWLLLAACLLWFFFFN